MSTIGSSRRPRLAALLVTVAASLTVPASTALAAHQFTDVPNDHQFHTEISIFKDTNITTGCTATTFCPQDQVKRQAMAAFIDRALGLLVRPGESTQRGVPGSRVEMLDDDLSFVGTQNGALELSHGGMRSLRLESKTTSPNVIGGHPGNGVAYTDVEGATIGGGGLPATPNQVTANHGTVAGGYDNTAGFVSFVGGGYSNTAEDDHAVVSGGYDNHAEKTGATVSGGQENRASGFSSTVPGGQSNAATGHYSLASGYRAKAVHNGSFVWADTTEADFASTAASQFKVRASGGSVFVKGSSTATSTLAALQLESFGDLGEGAWLRTASASNPSPVVKLHRHPTGTNNFLECKNWDGTNNAVAKCHINAAGTFVAGSDFAEAMPALGRRAGYAPGDVLVMSRTRPGSVERSSRPNERTVIGVHSTRPGVLGADKGGVTRVGREDVPVAITGIVPVKATAENGAIRPGDLLVSARLPGRAMRAGAGARMGTILGKAIEPLASGNGKIKMLVMLR